MQTVWFLDGLDECEEPQSHRKLLRFLNVVQHHSKIKMFVTSRGQLPEELNSMRQCLELKLQARDDDIRQYIHEKLKYEPMTETLKDEIETILVGHAGGMYYPP